MLRHDFRNHFHYLAYSFGVMPGIANYFRFLKNFKSSSKPGKFFYVHQSLLHFIFFNVKFFFRKIKCLQNNPVSFSFGIFPKDPFRKRSKSPVLFSPRHIYCMIIFQQMKKEINSSCAKIVLNFLSLFFYRIFSVSLLIILQSQSEYFFDDCLLSSPAIFSNCILKQISMIESYICYYRNQRRNSICRI